MINPDFISVPSEFPTHSDPSTYYLYAYAKEHIIQGKKLCRFIDSSYNELFTVPDNGYVQITCSDGEVLFRKCRYIDDYHTRIGLNDYHICQFAEVMERNGSKYAPVEQLEIVAGYTITDKMPVGNKTFVMAYNPDAVQPYVTWQGHTERPGYDWGHYFKDRSDANGDYVRRHYAERDNQPYQPKKKKELER